MERRCDGLDGRWLALGMLAAAVQKQAVDEYAGRTGSCL